MLIRLTQELADCCNQQKTPGQRLAEIEARAAKRCRVASDEAESQTELTPVRGPGFEALEEE